jgi:hypothetical protein
MADRRMGQAKLFSRLADALVAGGRLKAAQGLERWQLSKIKFALHAQLPLFGWFRDRKLTSRLADW